MATRVSNAAWLVVAATLFVGRGVLARAENHGAKKPATVARTVKHNARATAALRRMLETVENPGPGAIPTYQPTEARGLLLQKADPNVANSAGSTVLHFAAGQGDLETLKLCMRVGGSAKVRDQYGNTPLHNAALSGHPDAIRLLLGAGAPINAKCRDGFTALDLAYGFGHKDAQRLLRERGGRMTAAGRKLTPNPGGRTSGPPSR